PVPSTDPHYLERGMRFGPGRLAPCALLIASAASADAQYIHGRVTDASTGEGVASASVVVINTDESVRTAAITDRDGHFAFRTTPGQFRLQVQRVGYAPTGSTVLELTRADTLNFAVTLPLRPTELSGFTV